MAISSTLSINDRMTGALNRISMSIGRTIAGFESLDRVSEAAFDTTPISAVTRELGNYQRRVDMLENELLNANNRIEQMENNTKKASVAADGLKNTFLKIAGIIGTIGGIGAMVKLSDDITQTTVRLDQMNQSFVGMKKDALSTEQTMNAIFQAAENSRGSFSGMAAVVARFGNNAGEAFSSTAEVIKFSEIVQKQMTIAGASTEEASNAMLQLSQALGSGVLRGDELNSIFEQAPNLIRTIADHMGVNIGQIRELASEGKITADIVKDAMLSSADEIDRKFNKMPKTWGQLWQSFKNKALMAFRPVLSRMNQIANNKKFQRMVDGITNAVVKLADGIVTVIDAATELYNVTDANWTRIAPIAEGIVAIMAVWLAATVAGTIAQGAMAIAAGVAATAQGIYAAATGGAAAAQGALNASLYTCPVFWIVGAIGLVIIAMTQLYQKIADTTGAARTWMGVWVGVWNVSKEVFLNWVRMSLNNMEGMKAGWSAFCSNMEQFFNNMIAGISASFSNFMAMFWSNIGKSVGMYNNIVGVLGGNKIDLKSINAKVDGYKQDANSAISSINTKYKDPAAEFNKGSNVYDVKNWSDIKTWGAEAFAQGAKAGDALMDKFNNTLQQVTNPTSSFGNAGLLDGIKNAAENTAGNTKDIKDALDISNENLEWMRDLAEQEAINRFTTAEVTVSMGGITQNVSSAADADGIIAYLASGVEGAIQQAADGVHV